MDSSPDSSPSPDSSTTSLLSVYRRHHPACRCDNDSLTKQTTQLNSSINVIYSHLVLIKEQKTTQVPDISNRITDLLINYHPFLTGRHSPALAEIMCRQRHYAFLPDT